MICKSEQGAYHNPLVIKSFLFKTEEIIKSQARFVAFADCYEVCLGKLSNWMEIKANSILI